MPGLIWTLTACLLVDPSSLSKGAQGAKALRPPWINGAVVSHGKPCGILSAQRKVVDSYHLGWIPLGFS